jgi:hypothetical protein
LMKSPRLYELGLKLGRIGQVFHPLIDRSPLDPLRAWTGSRAFPKLARRSFREEWRKRKR